MSKKKKKEENEDGMAGGHFFPADAKEGIDTPKAMKASRINSVVFSEEVLKRGNKNIFLKYCVPK